MMALQSWVESANSPDTDFPLENLPYGCFRKVGEKNWRLGVAIGDQVLDLAAAHVFMGNDLRNLMQLPKTARVALRSRIQAGLMRSGEGGAEEQAAFAKALIAQSEATMGLPCEIGDYTDFYTSIHHATSVGKLFRPDNPLLPNYQWVPIGYHGRASSIVVSGTDFVRPKGQVKPPESDAPVFSASQRLDYELELGILVGQANAMGENVPIEQAEEHIFGLTLFNDWTARDIQAWEYQPLGPFLSKNFASSLSPWVVTLEALAPFRAPFTRPANHPQPLAYLDSALNQSQGAIDIKLEVWLQTAKMRAAGLAAERLMQSNFKDSYWTLAQLVAHHTVNGCNLQSGDLFGSGTQSGPALGQGGSMLELSLGGKQAITLTNGETRTFLQDGDEVLLKAYCENENARRIGFGECKGRVLPCRA